MTETLGREYIVDFDKYERDMRADAWARMLDQFQTSWRSGFTWDDETRPFDKAPWGKMFGVLRQFLDVYALQCQELFDALVELQRKRTVYEAEGVNLDALGRIVGWRRGDPLIPDITPWFGPDISVMAPDLDNAPVWVTGAEGDGQSWAASDPVYAYYIIAKAIRNHSQYCSVPEVVSFIKRLTGYDVRIDKTGPCEVVITVLNVEAASLGLREMLMNVVSDDTVDTRYIANIPAGCKVKAVLPY